MAIVAVPLTGGRAAAFPPAVHAAALLACRRGLLAGRPGPRPGQTSRRLAQRQGLSRRSLHRLVVLFHRLPPPSPRRLIRYRPNDRLAAGINVHVFDPNRFAAALELGADEARTFARLYYR